MSEYDDISYDEIGAELEAMAAAERLAGVIVRVDDTGSPYVVGKFAYDEDLDRVLYTVYQEGVLGSKVKPRGAGEYAYSTSGLLPSDVGSLFSAPEGYLARLLAFRHPDLPPPSDWRTREVVKAMLYAGGDLFGGLSYFRDEAAARAYFEGKPDPATVLKKRSPDEVAALTEIARRYGETERSATSSVGGAKPKCLVTVETPDGRSYEAIVKYAPLLEGQDNPLFAETNRQLVLEHACLETLRKAGIRAAETRLLRNTQTSQVFLEVRRGDRGMAPAGTRRADRPHWLSANTLRVTHGMDGLPEMVVNRACRESMASGAHPLGDAAFRDLQGRFWVGVVFSRIIGNTDMHAGNLSVMEMEKRGQRGLVPSAFYDVEPYALRSGEQAPAYMPRRKVIDIQRTDLPYAVPDKIWEKAVALRKSLVHEIAALARAGFLTRADLHEVAAYFEGVAPGVLESIKLGGAPPVQRPPSVGKQCSPTPR